MSKNTNPVRGTKDFLPAEMTIREKIRKVILNTYLQYGFSQIKTPIMENIDLLLGGDGGDNSKLIFKILKRGEKLDLNVDNENDLVDSGLRYDLTVPLARFYANNSNDLLPVFKSIQIDDVFRAERPQKGRYRQFTQCDIDIINESSIKAEIEVLYVSAKALLNLGFKNFTFKINDRRILNEIILNAGFKEENISDICISVDKIDKVGLEGVRNELISKKYNENKLDLFLKNLTLVKEKGISSLSKLKVNQEVIDDLKEIIDTINLLSYDKFEIVFDINIIRGQDYYTTSVFEIYAQGFEGAVGGGGRYDNMIEKMVGRNVPAVGFSLGFERLFLIIDKKEIVKDEKEFLALLYEPQDSFLEVIKKMEAISDKYNVNAIEKRKNFGYQLLNLKANGYSKYMLFSEAAIETIN